MIAAELPTRAVTCAACGVTHSNTALCDDCAAIVAEPCPWDGIEGCDCRSCLVASRACGTLAEALSDLNVYKLPEVRAHASRVELAPVVADASLPWERAYVPLTTLLETAHALAWRSYGLPRVRLSTLDGARWQVIAIDEEGAARPDVPTYIATSPDDAVAGWCALVELLAGPAVERGSAPSSLAERFPEGVTFSLTDETAPIIDRASGAVVRVIAARCAEVA